LVEQAQRKEQQQQQLQKNRKKKAAKSNTSTQVKTENGTTSVTGGIDSVGNIKKVAPKDQTATFTPSRPVRKGTYFEYKDSSVCNCSILLLSHSKQYIYSSHSTSAWVCNIS
jgi:hypothetical protein